MTLGDMTGNMSTRAALAGNLWNNPAVVGFRRIFYLASPNETSFKTIPEVPNYVAEAIPFFVVLQLLEIAWHTMKGRPDRLPRLNDVLSSLISGLVTVLPLLVARNVELAVYVWVNQKFSFLNLPWNSQWTWWLAFIGVDLGYYWVHRFAHASEINFMWAAHQVHHSSEDYNLSTSYRQSLLQSWSSWIFYLPLAVIIPPPIFLVHLQFSFLYQFWIHTNVIGTLGPLEYILVTPNHHRVHHGRNRYCIDKNFAGTLIIWDMMFGTFAWKEEEILYGVCYPIKSWDTLHIQFCHWKNIIRRLPKRQGFWNIVRTFLYGPGWRPGKPRVISVEELPDVHAAAGTQQKYDKKTSFWITVYTWLHFGLALVAYSLMMQVNEKDSSFYQTLPMAVYLLWTLTSIGFFMEDREYAGRMELLRCLLYLFVDFFLLPELVAGFWLTGVRVIFVASAMIWLPHL